MQTNLHKRAFEIIVANGENTQLSNFSYLFTTCLTVIMKHILIYRDIPYLLLKKGWKDCG